MYYIKSHAVSFDPTYTEMRITVNSRQRHAVLNPAPRQWPGYPEWVYVLAYSPEAGSTINGISTKAIEWTPALLAFVKEATGGVQFSKIYEAAKKETRRFDRVWQAEHRPIDRSDPSER